MLKGFLWKDMKLSQILKLVNKDKMSGILYIGLEDENQVLIKEGRIVYANYNDFTDLDALKEIAIVKDEFDFNIQNSVFFKSEFESLTDAAIKTVEETENIFTNISYLLDMFVEIGEGNEKIVLTSDEIKFLSSMELKPQSVKKIVANRRVPTIDTLVFLHSLIGKSVLTAYKIDYPNVFEYIVEKYPDLIEICKRYPDNLNKVKEEILKTKKETAKQIINEISRIK